MTGLQANADAAGLITWDVSVDSTIARAHQHAAGARTRPQDLRELPGGVVDEPEDHALGRSRGGLKRHRAVATRYGKLVVRYEAIVQIADINDWLTCLSTRPRSSRESYSSAFS